MTDAADHPGTEGLRPAVLIYNPTAGRRRARKLAELLPGRLRASGFDVTPMPTRGPGDATLLAREAVAQGAQVVFALGGDGTQRETARGLLGSNAALGILAAGTANVLPRALGIPIDALQAADLARNFEVRAFDVGLCRPESEDVEEPFLMMCSAGLDGHVLAKKDARLKALFGAGALVLRGLLEWGRYGYDEVRVREQTGTEPAQRMLVEGAAASDIAGSFVAVCNIPLYGGPFRLAPAARPDDGELDLLLLRRRDRWSTLKVALATVLGAASERPEIFRSTIREIRLQGPPSIYLQVDGDPVSWDLPVHIRVEPKALRILVPAQPGRGSAPDSQSHHAANPGDLP